MSELSANASLYLYNSDGSQQLRQSVNADNASEVITLNLKAGSYYFSVGNSSSGAGTTYKLEAKAQSLGATPVDSAGENIEKANDLGTLDSDGVLVNDFIGNFNGLVVDNSDSYKFSLAENSTVNLKLSELSANANLYLYNSDGTALLVQSINVDNANEVITRNLKAGSYYLNVVNSSSGAGTTYKLEASATSLGAIPQDTAGDNFDKASYLGTLGSDSVTVNDFIGNFNGLVDDNNDYYKFDLAENSTVNLKLSELSANATLYLYNSNGSRILDSSTNGDNDDEVITRNLKAGSYYILVQDYYSAAGTTYKLEASANPTQIDDENEFDRATDIGTLSTTAFTINDSVGNNNFSDYFKFELSENSTINLKLSELSANATLYLYNSDGSQLLASSSNAGNANEIITRNLKAGSYYFNVVNSSSGAGTTYKLEASAISLGATPLDIAGDNLDKAKDLETLSSDGVTVNDFIGNFNGFVVDQNDYYKFSLAENSVVNLKLSELSANANLYLYNSDGSRQLAQSLNADNVDETINLNLKAGQYSLLISGGGSNGTTYKLEAKATSLGATPVDIAGENIDKASYLGTLNATGVTVNDFIGNFNGLTYDSSDYYKFSLAENSSVNLNLSELSTNANLYLYNSDGSRELAQSVNAGNVDETITHNLKAGTYYFQVTVGSNQSTTYKLEAKATSLGATPVDIAGENIDKAKDLGALNSDGVIVNDFVGDFNRITNDSSDYYRFELAENSSVNLNLSELSTNANLYLYNSDGSRLLAQSGNPDNADETINLNLKAGIYYFQVSSRYDVSGTTYKLEAKATSLGATPVDIAGESFDKAKDLGNLSTTVTTVNDFIGDFNGLVRDSSDFYRFELTENSTINLKLSELNANASLSLHNSDGSRLLDSSSNADNADEVITRNLKAGIYNLVVYSSDGKGTTYKLEASTNPLDNYQDNAGDSLGSARDIGILDSSQDFTDFIGNYNGLIQDNADFYRFQIKESSSINLSLGGFSPSTGASLQLLNSQGNFIKNSTSNTLNTSLFAGTYYFRIFPTSNNGTNYNLTATGIPIPDFAGNSINKARDISILSGTQIFTDFVGDIDRDDFYKFELLKDSTVNLALSPEILGTNLRATLFGSQGNYIDNSSTAINRNLTAGIYYAQIRGDNSNDNSNYDLAFSAIANNNNSPLQITGISPVEGSNVGQTTITVKGSQFTSKSQVSIIDATGKEVLADKVRVQSDTLLTATFNLVGVATGAYDVKIVDDAETATVEDLFQVSTGNPGKLDVFISAPDAIRPWGAGEVVVTYRNSGDTNITAPLLTLSAEGALFYESGEYQDSTVQFLGINKQGDAGVLPPGATGSFSVRFRPKDNNVTNINFQVNSLATDETVDWNAIKDSSRPQSIPVEAWEVIFNNFTQEVGEKAGEYEKVLAENASRLSELGEYTGDISQLLAFELQQVNSQGIFERFNLGSFGRGWNNPWDITATTDAEGNVTIQNGGSLRFFEKQGNGSYKGEEGDNATLTQSGDTYRLRESGGTVVGFGNDGKLDFIQDTNNNQVTAGYTDAKLTTLTYTNGDVITFAYNGEKTLLLPLQLYL
ncbi:MAG: T9SS type A sorting domain-containing protein [Richelia sp. RM1_1_1]|nr:T9SS type A sorting domain-containing protein [Richelia sp. RM1_1_1]